MPLFGMSGSPDELILSGMQASLAHRGETKRTGSVGGEFIERSGGIALSWSGSLRRPPASLIEAYNQNGIDFAKELDGEFIIAIRDGQTLHLIRDHAGARSVYYGAINHDWFIGAEPKAIWSLPGFERTIRPGAIAQYFAYSFVPGSPTMLKNLWDVPPGHCVSLTSGEPARLHRYFAPGLTPTAEPVPMTEWPSRFRRLLEEEVASRLENTDQPTVFLSGGLDSSIVTAEVVKQSSQRVKTFSIHFGKKYPNELDFAREVATRFNTDHEEVEITPKDAVRRLREMVWRLDEPIGDPITAPNLELAAHASHQGIREVFNGEGGDPLFGGPKNLPMLMSHWYGGVQRGPKFREQRYIESYRRGFEELPHLLTPAAMAECDFDRDLYAPLTPFFEADGPFLHKLLAINTQLKGGHLILPKVERMLAVSGLTPLSPMFTRRMIALSLASPPTAKLQGGVEKWLLKEAYRDELPASVIERPKSGMRVPVHFWFKGPLKRFARNLLDPKKLRTAGIFNPDRVKQWIAYDIEKPHGRYGLRLWMLLTFELWRRIVVEDEPV